MTTTTPSRATNEPSTGPGCRTVDELAGALDGVFDKTTVGQTAEYEWKRKIFVDHLDDQASWRVVKRLYLDDEGS